MPASDETILTPTICLTPKALIIDGNKGSATSFQRDLQQSGYLADITGDAHQALAQLQAQFVPMVIVDLDIDRPQGLQFCREIRTRQFPGYVYVLVRSDRKDEETMLESYAAGADDYLNKDGPFTVVLARLNAAQRVLAHERSLMHMLSERRKLSLTDSLTSAFNRRYLLKYGQRALSKAQDEKQPASLLTLDLDHFKSINDRFGHGVGDQVLVEFVRRVRGLLKEDEWCARVGGEEFTVFLPCTDPPRAKRVAERLRKAVAAEPFSSGRLIIPVTVSVGAASPLEGMNIEQLMRRADKALYRSKREGRNKSTVLSRRG